MRNRRRLGPDGHLGRHLHRGLGPQVLQFLVQRPRRDRRLHAGGRQRIRLRLCAEHALAYARDAALSLRAGLRAIAPQCAGHAHPGGHGCLLCLARRLRGSRRPDVWEAVQYAAAGSALDAADDLVCRHGAVRCRRDFHGVGIPLSLLFRDRALLNRIYGPQSLEEEISTEIGHAEAREGINRASRT